MDLDYDDFELGADELTPEKPYTPERREEINELLANIAALAAEITV